MVRRLAGCGALQSKEPSAHGRWSAFFSAVLRPCGFAVRESKRHQKRRLPTIAAARAPALPRLARGFHFIRGHVEDNHVQKPPRREGTRGDFPFCAGTCGCLFCAGLRSCLPCAGRCFPICPGPARKRTRKRAAASRLGLHVGGAACGLDAPARSGPPASRARAGRARTNQRRA